MLGNNYFQKSMNGIISISDGQTLIQNGEILNVDNIQASNASFDNINSSQIETLILNVSDNTQQIQINKTDIANLETSTIDIDNQLETLNISTQNNTIAINDLTTSLNNNITFLEGRVSQNQNQISINTYDISNIYHQTSMDINKLINQSNLIVGSNYFTNSYFNDNVIITNGYFQCNQINCDNINMDVNATINQQTNTDHNYLSKTIITDLQILDSLVLPSNISIGGSTHTDDIIMNNAVILQSNNAGKINAFTGSDFFGNVKIIQNLENLSTTTLNNLVVQGSCILPAIIQSQTITNINNDINNINNDITTINTSITGINNNILDLDNNKANLLNPTFTNDVNISNLLTINTNGLIINDIGTSTSDNNYICSHRGARLIAENIINNNLHDNITCTNLTSTNITTDNITINGVMQTNFKFYDKNDLTSDLIGNGVYNIGNYKNLLNASQIASMQISSGDNGSQSIFITSGGDFFSLHQSIQAWDSFRNYAIPLKIQPLGGDCSFGGNISCQNITSPTIDSINAQITNINNQLQNIATLSHIEDINTELASLQTQINTINTKINDIQYVNILQNGRLTSLENKIENKYKGGICGYYLDNVTSFNYNLIPIICSNRRLQVFNDDDGWIVFPGYSFLLYYGNDYTSECFIINNFSGSTIKSKYPNEIKEYDPLYQTEKVNGLTMSSNSVNSVQVFYINFDPSNEITCTVLS